jgi:hypothetical protein
MKTLLRIGLAVAALAAPLAAQAHHSHAMFDTTKTEEIEGTVKAYNYANPHVYLFLVKPGPTGAETTYPIEMSFIQNMLRQGVSGSTFKPGDKVTILVNPYRSGQPGGSYRGAIDAQGKRYGALNVEAAPRTAAE